MKKFKDLQKLIDENEKFLLIGHVKPDGDALGALFSFDNYLKSHKKKSTIVLKDSVPELFSYIISGKEVEIDFLTKDFDVIVFLDCGDLKRTGFADQIISAKKNKILIANIDHHPRNDIWKLTKYNFSDPNASSTCEIIYNFFNDIDIKIGSKTATALLSGIYYDTGGFLHSNTSNDVLRIASRLMSMGAKLKKISKSVNQKRSVAMLNLWGIALNNIVERSDLGLVVAVLTNKDIVNSKANEEEISGLVNLLATASEARVSMLIYETLDGKIRGSLRTEDNSVDVSKFASLFGGGGHRRASGFVIDGKISKSKNFIKIV